MSEKGISLSCPAIDFRPLEAYHMKTQKIPAAGGDFMRPMAPIKSIMYRSPDPKTVYTYSPGICALESGRLIGTLDVGGQGVERHYQNTAYSKTEGYQFCGMVFISDDHGATWRQTVQFPFCHARPFTAGKSLYVLGHAKDLRIIRSDDGGETWTEAAELTSGEFWHQAPANVCYAGENVYLVMERVPDGVTGWPVRALEPVLMRGNIHDDLTLPESWTFSDSMEFRQVMQYENTDYFGIPFYPLDLEEGTRLSNGAYCAPLGWLETNVVHISDENHIWYDPTGHTFHLFMRAHTGRTNYCCVMKVVEQSDGSMKMERVVAPSGKTLLYLPMPGGQMKFHILYDAPSGLYWLLSSQSTDSMAKPETMSSQRFGLPDNERHRLQLHFSTNCVDWCFAGLVDMGKSPLESRHYASMCISGEYLYILSRSGDEEACSAHNTDIITLHEIPNFRNLAY